MTISSVNGGAGTVNRYTYNATGGETTISGTDSNGATISYLVGKEEVYVNGVLLVRTTDYTATNGTSVVLVNALVAGDVIEIVTFSSFAIPTAISSNTVTAKGDLIVANGAATVTNLAVGADGTTLVANSSVSTGVSWAGNIAAGKNAAINGAFDIWQRGTSFTPTVHQYCADRWDMGRFGGVSGAQITQQASGLTGFQYAARLQRQSGNTGTQAVAMITGIETKDSLRFAGQSATLSFYARAGANFSASGSAFTAQIITGTGTDESPWAGFTGQTTNSTNVTLTTSYQRFTYTVSIASNTTEIALQLYFTPTGTAGTNDYIEITGVQLEQGSVATPFSRAGGTLQGELAACQRYYWRSSSGVAYAEYAWGVATSSTQVNLRTIAPVPMRIVPTSMDYNQLQCGDEVNSAGLLTGLTMSGGGSTNTIMNMTASQSSGFTQYRPYFLFGTSNTGNYLGFSAEL